MGGAFAKGVGVSGAGVDGFITHVNAGLRALANLTVTNASTYRAVRRNLPTAIANSGMWKAQPVSPGNGWDKQTFKNCHRAVTKNEEGVCSTFAPAAAHVLTENRTANNSPRLEIVSTDAIHGHVFVLVGREGADVRSGIKLPLNKKWGSSARIVDVWQCALDHGEGGFVFDVNLYPYRSKINGRTTLVRMWV